MTNFDFHRLLFPSEFEKLCLDILKIREPGLEFRTFGEWKDNGIDILCTSENKQIIGQCKRYNPNNYNSFKQSLKREVKKCKKENPERYILLSSVTLGVDQFNEIEELFEGYLKRSDIIDSEKLNEFLRDEKNYGHIFKAHSKLLVPNFQSLELALDKVVHRKYYQKTTCFLNEIESKHRLFHHTDQLPFLIKHLEENKVLILTGNPGVGKTATAMMIANYFLNKKVKDLIFLEERDYVEVLSIIDENRLVIVDDFWGQKFSPEIKNHSTFQREFQRIISHFINSDNRFLILTSRDYVIKDVLKVAEQETEILLNENKCIINIEECTDEEKVKILLNHLLFYDFDLSYIKRAHYDNDFEYIIKHKNYSPRHLDFFIRKYLKEDYQSSHAFYKSLHKYLDNPSIFWNEAFQKLNPTAKSILLILLVSGDPMSINDLRSTFDDIQIEVRRILNEAIIPLDFNRELKNLDEFYISIGQDGYYYSSVVQFQSPGIKDYLLEFLRNEGYLWIQPIILNAKFFNQLTFVFSTKEEDVSDYESDTPLFGKKILLSKNLLDLLKHKLLSEFEDLNFCNYDGKELTDELTRYNSKDETKYFKLIELNHLFPIEHEENHDVRDFILEKVLADILSFSYDGKLVAHRSMIYFPSVIKFLYLYLNVKPNEIIQKYYNSISFATEYEYFYGFKKIFPQEFEKFYHNNIHKIRKHIKELIFDDIDYYLNEEEEGIGMELDYLLSAGIEELRKLYKLRITDRFIQNLEASFDINCSSLRKNKKSQKKFKRSSTGFKNKYEPKPYTSIIDEYLPTEDETYNPLQFLRTHGHVELIKEVKNSKSALSSLKSNKEIFETLCHFIVECEIVVKNLDTCQLLDLYIKYYCNKNNIEKDCLIKIGFRIIEELNQTDHYSITKSKINEIIKELKLLNFQIKDLSPVIIPYKNWFRFSHSDIEKYILTKYIDFFEGEQFLRSINEFLCVPNDIKLLEFIQTANENKLWGFYIIPELKRLLKNINLINQQETILSFVDFFNIEFELAWNKKEKVFEVYTSSNVESHYEHILLFCKKEFNIHDFETYFLKDYQNEDTILRLGINTKVVNKLVKQVICTVSKKTANYCMSEEQVAVFEIKLLDFLKLDENFKIAKEVGMVSYVNDLIFSIRNIIENKKVQTATNSQLNGK
ncbi:MAG: restriction endonuclease [Cytophagaceae bacterium]